MRRPASTSVPLLHAVARRLSVVLLVLGTLLRPVVAQDDPGDWVSLVVLHTNDVHGAVLPRSPALAQLEATEDVGGFAALAAVVKAERAAAAARGAHVLLVDGGDVWRGTPEGDLTKGDLIVEAFGRLGYDAVALGNHEFDLGLPNAVRLAKAAPFPWVSANVTEKATGATPSWLRTHVVKEVGGLRVALVGMTTVETPRIVVGGDALGLAFAPPAEAAAAQAKALAATSDLVIFVTHLGPQPDVEILKAVPTCPLVVGGHSHTRLAKPIDARGDGTGWVVQAGTACIVVGKVTLDVHRTTKAVRLRTSALIPLIPSKVGRDAETEAFLAGRLDAIAELKALKSVVGTLTGDLPRVGANPRDTSPAGHFMADATRAAAGADVGLANRGGIRVVLPAGPVTRRDLFLLMPFDNTVVTQTLTGAELREIVGFSLKTGLSGRISPLEVSGLTARFRIVEREGKQAVEWLAFDVGGRPLDDAKAYRVALNSFLAGGGDGYKQLVKPDAKDTGVLVRDVLGDALGKAGTYAPDRASRLVEEK